MKYEPKGPPRYRHQNEGLRKLIATKGTGALLFDPGLGKTMTALDFASILALKLGEARILVTCPLVAVDTWVDQARKFVSDQVNVWAEVIGGSIVQRAEALAARGGNPFKRAGKEVAQSRREAPRALGVRRAVVWYARADGRSTQISPSEGPDGLGDAKPKLIIEIINLDAFSSRQTYGSRTIADVMLAAVHRYKPDLVIVDEMHKIKGATSNVSRLISRVGDIVPRRIGLTGTVMPAGPLDVFGQWRFIDPYAFGHRKPDGTVARSTMGSFRDEFAVLGGYLGREVIGYRNLNDMQRIMAQRAVVARKEDALDLPEITDINVPVHLSPREEKAYQDLKKDLRAILTQGQATTVDNRLTQMLRLRQITSGHLPDDQGVMHDLGSSKAKVIDGIVNDTLAGEHRIVIFCVFTAEIKDLTQRLKRPGTDVLVATGATSTRERMALRARFGSDDPTRMIFLAQIQTMSLAVNELVTANHAVFGSLSQRRDELVQARDRLHRIGQTRPVTFWYALVPSSVDDVIMQSHMDRTNLEQAMLNHIRGEPTG